MLSGTHGPISFTPVALALKIQESKHAAAQPPTSRGGESHSQRYRGPRYGRTRLLTIGEYYDDRPGQDRGAHPRHRAEAHAGRHVRLEAEGHRGLHARQACDHGFGHLDQE